MNDFNLFIINIQFAKIFVNVGQILFNTDNSGGTH